MTSAPHITKKSCIVIIGYGIKSSFATGRERKLDLDETYDVLIEPVFKEIGINCYRAMDINDSSGNIDEVMLNAIKNADIAVADISTLNANVMWELGVRHALKPMHTIIICEKGQENRIPFDLSHFVVHFYVHSEEGLPNKTVKEFPSRFKKEVVRVLNLDPPKVDSPVFYYLGDQVSGTRRSKTKSTKPESAKVTFSRLMDEAEACKRRLDFTSGLQVLARAKKIAEKNFTLADSIPQIIRNQVLYTYKSKRPDEKRALKKALQLLEALNPEDTRDTEVLGLGGAIHKRLHALTGNEAHLDQAISYYEKGFRLLQDYYNGINTAFMYLVRHTTAKAKGKKNDQAEISMRYHANQIINICKKMMTNHDFSSNPNRIWIILSLAEAYHLTGDIKAMIRTENIIKKYTPPNGIEFEWNAYLVQKERIEVMLTKGIDSLTKKLHKSTS